MIIVVRALQTSKRYVTIDIVEILESGIVRIPFATANAT